MSDNAVRVPKPSSSAYNPNRPLEKNALLQSHVTHLQHAEMQLPPEQRTGVEIRDIKTEGEAAEYIRKVTSRLHPLGEKVRTAT
jgi:hypothetical protein